MPTITVAQIRVRSDQKANMENSNFVSQSEQLSYINEAYFNYYDLIVDSFQDYNVSDPLSFSLAAGESSFDLPADFYKLSGVDRETGASGSNNDENYYPLRNYPWRSRNRFQASFSRYGLYPRVGYRLIGSKLTFVPNEQAEGNYRLWYVPLAQELVNDTDTIERYNGFEQLIVIDTAIKMLNKEESDTGPLMIERERQIQRMKRMLIDRDISDGDRIEEVDRGLYQDFEWPLF